MSQLLAHVQSFFSESLRQKISEAVSEPADQVNRGIANGITVLLAGLAAFIDHNDDGHQPVRQAMENEVKSGLLEHLDSILQGQGLDLVLQQGTAYLTSFFAREPEKLRQGMSRSSGLSEAGAERLLRLMLPIVLAMLGRQVKQTDATAENLTQTLQGQKLRLFAMMPLPLQDIFSEPATATATVSNMAKSSLPLSPTRQDPNTPATVPRPFYPDTQASPSLTATQRLFDSAPLPALPRSPVPIESTASLPAHMKPYARKESMKIRQVFVGLIVMMILGAGYFFLRPSFLTGQSHDAAAKRRENSSPASAGTRAQPFSRAKDKENEDNPPVSGENTASLLTLPPNDPALTIGSALLPLPGIKGSLGDLHSLESSDLPLADQNINVLAESVPAENAASASASVAGTPSNATFIPRPSETPVNPVVPDPVEVVVKTVQLPNGREAKINPDGMDGQLHDFLTKATPADITLVFDQVAFGTGSSVPEESSNRQLEAVAALLKAWPAVSGVVQGHTDNGGKAVANQTVSNARAAAVRKQLISLGVRASQLTAKGFGATKPLVPNDNEENRLKNRRIELLVKRK